MPVDRGWRSSSRTAALLPIGLGLIGIAIAFYPMISSKFEQMQSDPGDTRFANFILEYEYRWLRGDALAHELWSPGIFSPERNTLAYSNVFLGLLPVYFPWRLVGAAPDTAYQLLLLTVGLLNFGLAYLLFRNGFEFVPLASSFGAFLFAFGSIRLNQLGQPQLFSQFYILISLYGLVQILKADLETGPRYFGHWLFLFFGGITAQFYSDYYHGWFYLFALGLCGIWGLSVPETRPPLLRLLHSRWKWLTVGLLAWSASLAPLGIHYLRAAQRVGLREFGQIEGMLPRFQSWFYVGSENWLWGWLSSTRPFESLPMRWEHRLGLGVVTSIVFVYMLWRGRKSLLFRLFTFVCVAVILLSSLYRGHFTPWALLFHVIPGANAIRAVSRIGFLLLLPASYALASFVEQSHAHPRRWWLLGISALSLLEQGRAQLSYDKRVIRQQVEAVVSRVGRGDCAAFYYSPRETSRPAYQSQLDAMWAYLASGLPTVNGYSGNTPPGWELEDSRIGGSGDELRLSHQLEAWARRQRSSPLKVCWIKSPSP